MKGRNGITRAHVGAYGFILRTLITRAKMQTANSVTPLSTTQERRLVDYLEEQFLELTRGYKKR